MISEVVLTYAGDHYQLHTVRAWPSGRASLSGMTARSCLSPSSRERHASESAGVVLSVFSGWCRVGYVQRLLRLRSDSLEHRQW